MGQFAVVNGGFATAPWQITLPLTDRMPIRLIPSQLAMRISAPPKGDGARGNEALGVLPSRRRSRGGVFGGAGVAAHDEAFDHAFRSNPWLAPSGYASICVAKNGPEKMYQRPSMIRYPGAVIRTPWVTGVWAIAGNATVAANRVRDVARVTRREVRIRSVRWFRERCCKAYTKDAFGG